MAIPTAAEPDSLVRTRFAFGRAHLGPHVVVGRAGRLGLRPLGKGIEEARDVFDHLAGILAGKVTPKAPLPQRDSAIDQVVIGYS